MKRIFAALAVCLCGALVFVPGCGAPSSGDGDSFAETYPGYADDFYEAVNKDTFDVWEIPESEPSIDNFYVVCEENRARLREILEEVSGNVDAERGSDERNVGALWATAMDAEARNAGGLGVAEDYVAAIDAAQSKEELLSAALVFEREYGCVSFIGMGIAVDSDDSESYTRVLGRADTGLTREEWESDEPETKKRVALYRDLLTELWEQRGLSAGEAAAKADAVCAAMAQLASSSLTVDELYDPAKAYNPHELSEIGELYGGLVDPDEVYGLYGGAAGDKLVVQDEGLLAATAAFLKEADLALLKDYAASCLYMDLARYSTTEAEGAVRENRKARLGLEELSAYEDYLTDEINEELAFECGRLYARERFDDAVRADIQAMIDDIVEVYERRIEGLDWMGEATKAEAKAKLAAIKANIGVPDAWPQDRYDLELARPEEGGLYVDNILAVYAASRDSDFARLGEPVDKTEWYSAPQEVNAYYDPVTNSITLMAGILQAPFYSAEATPEQNLGRIGMVIAHEITHAFDSGGSQYDERGNLRDWWTEEDAERFEALSQGVADYYDGQKVSGIAINGRQTLSENIADLGAVACITEVARERGYDLSAVYVAYAQNWAGEMRDEYLAELIDTDTHAPGKIRANAVPSSTDGFYEALGIEEGDGMYVAPETRVGIW